jgi:hypothetical protein
MSTSKIMDLLDQFPGQRLIDILQVPMKLLGGLKLEVEIYEEEGVPKYRYGVIDPVGIVKDKGEALLSMPMDILRVFMRQSTPSESP